MLKNTYQSPNCKPEEQPCCWRAPLTPQIKCNKARAEAASKAGDLGSQIGSSFNNLQTTFADAKAIADRQACQQKIIGNALKYLQDAACDAAMKTPTDDISGIWPEVLKEAKGMGDGEAYTKCDGPYNHVVIVNGCKDKCAQPATLQALYGGADSGAANKCFNDCMRSRNIGKMPVQGFEDAKKWHQTSCESQCIPQCEAVGLTAAELCKKCKAACRCRFRDRVRFGFRRIRQAQANSRLRHRSSPIESAREEKWGCCFLRCIATRHY